MTTEPHTHTCAHTLTHTHTHTPHPTLPPDTHRLQTPATTTPENNTHKHGPALSGTRDMVLKTGTVCLCTFCQKATVKYPQCIFQHHFTASGKEGDMAFLAVAEFCICFSGVKRMLKKIKRDNKSKQASAEGSISVCLFPPAWIQVCPTSLQCGPHVT